MRSILRFASAFKLTGFAFAICSGFALAAFAEDAGTPAETEQQSVPGAPPAPAPQNPLPGTKPTDATTATKDVQSCLDETGDFVAHGKVFTYVIGLENKCTKRVKCTVDAYITGAKGPVSVHTVMTLDAKSKKTYAAKVKTSGGTAEVSRDCKVL
jgi:hypothetical protein